MESPSGVMLLGPLNVPDHWRWGAEWSRPVTFSPGPSLCPAGGVSGGYCWRCIPRMTRCTCMRPARDGAGAAKAAG